MVKINPLIYFLVFTPQVIFSPVYGDTGHYIPPMPREPVNALMVGDYSSKEEVLRNVIVISEVLAKRREALVAKQERQVIGFHRSGEPLKVDAEADVIKVLTKIAQYALASRELDNDALLAKTMGALGYIKPSSIIDGIMKDILALPVPTPWNDWQLRRSAVYILTTSGSEEARIILREVMLAPILDCQIVLKEIPRQDKDTCDKLGYLAEAACYLFIRQWPDRQETVTFMEQIVTEYNNNKSESAPEVMHEMETSLRYARDAAAGKGFPEDHITISPQ